MGNIENEEYIEELEIYGINNAKPYIFRIHKDMEGAKVKETIFLICQVSINVGVINEKIKDEFVEPTYFIKGIGYTTNFWKNLIDGKLVCPGIPHYNTAVAYYWNLLPEGKTLNDMKNDILSNTQDYPGIIEIVPAS